MGESGFSNEPRDEAMEAGRKGGKPAQPRTFAEENHAEAMRLLQLFEERRQRLGLRSPIGRIGLIDGVGVNFRERDLRPPARGHNQES